MGTAQGYLAYWFSSQATVGLICLNVAGRESSLGVTSIPTEGLRAAQLTQQLRGKLESPGGLQTDEGLSGPPGISEAGLSLLCATSG